MWLFVPILIILGIVCLAIAYFRESMKDSDLSLLLSPHSEEHLKGYEERMRQRALEAGFSNVEDYLQAQETKFREEQIKKLIEKDGLTREEAECFEWLGSRFSPLDNRAKRRGVSFLEEKKFQEICQRPPRGNCTHMYEAEEWGETFAEEGSISVEVREHLSQCADCNLTFRLWAAVGEDGVIVKELQEKIDALCLQSWVGLKNKELAQERGITPEEYVKWEKQRMIELYGGDDCFTLKERIVYARTLQLPAERFAHTNTCPGCQRMIMADREDFVQTGRIGGLAMRALEEQAKAKKEGREQ